MVGLVNSGYFDGQLFHRVIDKFVLQAGDPKTLQPFDATNNPWGTGGPGFTFDDEFNAAGVFTGDGQLAMANSGKDTNGSQFFITEGPQRALDFNHTLWGQLVRGKATRDAISNVSTDSSGKPSSDVRITRVRVIKDTTDAVLVVRATGVVSGSVKVTATGAEGASSRSFALSSSADKVNDPPVLTPPPTTLYTPVNTPLTYKLSGFDLEGDPIEYGGLYIDGAGAQTAAINEGILSLTPKTGFTGKITLYVGAGVKGATSRGSTPASQGQPLGGVFDTQTITIAVGEQPIYAAGAAIHALAGAPTKSAVVATFRDADRRGLASQFTAKINWGDGTVTDGTVVKNTNNTFSVLGTHAYDAGAAAADYPVTVDIAGNLGATAKAESTATVVPFASTKAGILTVNGSSVADRIGVSRKNGNILVTVNGQTKAFDQASVTQIRAYGYDGNDLIGLAETGVPGSYLDGGLGKDRLFGQDGNDFISGDGSPDIISGDAGNDTLLGGGGGDNVQGGTGNDVINILGGGIDIADGGPGTNIGKYDDDDTIARLVLA
jgi:cyclophilin family peptidyl-prolyl cis-trans isomerase